MFRRLTPLFLVLMVGAAGCKLEPITTQPPVTQPPVTQPPAKPTAPSAPGPVTAQVEPGAVTLSWSPPESDGGSALTGYRVRGEPPYNYLYLEVDGPTARITGLNARAIYLFSVVAVNAVGESSATRAEAVTLPDFPGRPPQPSVVRGDGQVTVSWAEPDTDGRSPLTGYLVTAHPQGVTVTVDASTRSTVVGGLNNGEPSTFTVRAVNAVGEGPDSSASPSVVPAAVPSAPASVEATAEVRAATITWSAPESTGGLPVQAYVVTAEPGGASREVGAESRSITITGLEDGTAYAFTVTARNEVGGGPGRLSAQVHTPDVPAQPGAVEATVGVRSVTVTWEAPAEDGGSPLTGFLVEASPSGTRVQVDAQTHSATFTGLSSTQAHSFTVSATNAVGSGAPSAASAAVRPLPAPAEVTALQVDASDAGCLTVSYALHQPDEVRADIVVEVEAQGSGTFTRATQAGSTTHEGLLARSASPEGSTHTFLWDRGFDVPGASTVRVRLSARVPGAEPGSSTLELSLPAAARVCEVHLPTTTVQPLTARPYKAVKGDFNRDGKPDLAVPHDSSDTVSILLGLGNGGFQPPFQQKLQYTVDRLAAADLDGDGADDLVWPNGSGSLWVARNLGYGSFSEPAAYVLGALDWFLTSDSPIALADFDGNGSPDVATLGGSGSHSLGLLTNTGYGTLDAFTTLPATVHLNAMFQVADLDEDGREDLLAIGQYGGSVALLSNGDGTFRSRPIITPYASSLAVADLDGDGHLDLALARKDSPSNLVQVHLLRGDGQGGFSAAELVDSLEDGSSGWHRQALAAADVDRDGLMDLGVGLALEWGNSLAVLRGLGEGRFAPAVMLPTGLGPVDALTGDFDGDGVEDLVTVQEHSRDVRVWHSGPEALSLPGGLAGALAQGDFNGDGWMDVVSASAPDSIQVHLAGSSEGLRAQAPVPVEGSAFQFVVGHVDEDEKLDLMVWVNLGTNSPVRLLLGNGDGTFRRVSDLQAGAKVGYAALGDVNGDGRMDLACQVTFYVEAGYYTEEVRVLLGQGQGTFGPPTVVTTSPEPNALTLGDLDRDGALDMIVVQDSPGGGVLLLKGRGDGTFLSPILVSSGAGQFSGRLVLADLNGDGRLDIVRSNPTGNSVHVVRNPGNWMTWEGWSYEAGGNCFSVSVRDFDGDGRQDVLCANPGMDSVSLLRGESYGQLAAPRVFGVRTGVHELAVLDANADGLLDILTGGPLSTQGTLLLQR